MLNNKNKISNRAIKKMHQERRKLSFFAVFSPLTYVLPLFLLISGMNVAAQEQNSRPGVRFKNNHFSLDLPDEFERRTINTNGVILSVRYRNSFPTLNIVESPGSSKYPSHLKVEQRVLESYNAVGIQQPLLLDVATARFGAVNLSEPLVILGYTLNDEQLKAEVGFIDVKGRYFTITLVERTSATGDELNAGRMFRENLKWIGRPLDHLVPTSDHMAQPNESSPQLSNALGNFFKQILGILGIIIGVFILAKVKTLLWKRL